jgi:peptide/nickel transport system permease protein
LAPAIAVPPTARTSRGLWWDALGRFSRNGPAVAGLVCVSMLALAALFAPLVAPSDPRVGDLAAALHPPSLAHLMGTDELGRDLLSRVLYGARPSLQLGVLAVAIGLLLGGGIGAAAGVGTKLDFVVMRITDVLLTIPGILLAILIVAWLGNGELQLILAVGVRYTPVFARLLRGSLLALGQADFVTAARSTGASSVRVLVRHMLPNAISPLVVQATLSVATAIIDVASIGFLGLGPGDPRVAEWGEMLTGSERFLQNAPHLVLFPGAAIVLTAIGFNLVGDGLRESLDPRLKR